MNSQSIQPKPKRSRSLFDFLLDVRVLSVIGQIVFLVVLVLFFSILWANVLGELESRNLTPKWDVIRERRAGLPIPDADSPPWYNTDEEYGVAFKAGVVNTLRVVVIGLVAATVLSVFFGIFLLSGNWLIRTITRAYVEIIRNTPLLIQLIFIYFGVFLALPNANQATGLPADGVFVLPYRIPMYVLLFIGIWLYARSRAEHPSRILIGTVAVIILMELIFALQGYSANLMLAMGVVGGMVFVISWFAPSQWKDWLLGISLMPLLQVLFGMIFHMLYVVHVLPDPQYIISEVHPLLYPTAKGLFYPEFIATSRFPAWLALVATGIVAGLVIWYVAGYITEATGRPIRRELYATLVVVGFVVFGWGAVGLPEAPSQVVVETEQGAVLMNIEDAQSEGLLTAENEILISQDPLIVQLPQKQGLRITGSALSIEYMALLFALVINSSAPMAEVVRAGIQAVPYGQTEAARAVGLSTSQTLSQIVLPQALRVIIPPMGNQYLNLAKNSSLGLAIGFADTYQVSQSMMNQSGESVTGFTLVLLVYLSMSLVISLGMNMVNSRFQLVTR